MHTMDKARQSESESAAGVHSLTLKWSLLTGHEHLSQRCCKNHIFSLCDHIDLSTLTCLVLVKHISTINLMCICRKMHEITQTRTCPSAPGSGLSGGAAQHHAAPVTSCTRTDSQAPGPDTGPPSDSVHIQTSRHSL